MCHISYDFVQAKPCGQYKCSAKPSQTRKNVTSLEVLRQLTTGGRANSGVYRFRKFCIFVNNGHGGLERRAKSAAYPTANRCAASATY